MNDIESTGINSTRFLNNSVTCIGGREENQDTCGLVETRRGFLALVCDGMGGMNGGATASKIAVEEIIRFIDMPGQEDSLEDDSQMLLRKAICHANKVLFETASANPSLSGMGTTVTALLIDENKATVAYVGDSRVYQIRNGRKIFRTFDHSMVFEMVKKRILTEEQARLSAQSNIILRALGQKEDVVVDTFDLSYDKGDIFFLCTDGIWGTMPEKQLIKRLSTGQHPKAVTETLAMSIHGDKLREGGGHDNLTAAMIQTTTNSIVRNKMEETTKKALMVCAALLVISIICNFIPRSAKKAEEKTKVIHPQYGEVISQEIKKGEVDTLVVYFTPVNENENNK